MQSEPLDWTVPAPLRALLWWPPVALVVAMLEPAAAAGTIAVAGGVLVALGVLVSAIGRTLARRLAAGNPLDVEAAEPGPRWAMTGDATAGAQVEQRAA